MNNIKHRIKELFIKSFPQNFLIKKPFTGTLIFFVISFTFVTIYHPLGVSKSGHFSFILTMLAYCFFISISELLVAIVIYRTNCFSPKNNWTIANEIFTILLLLLTVGISTYLSGFVIQPESIRCNFSILLDSFYRSILIGIIPIVLPFLLNIKYAFAQETFQEFNVHNQTKEDKDVLINIESKAKKEHLSFYPEEFLYAESEGNYVIFHLIKQGKQTNVTIRNSISNIETQLSTFPNFMRTHRAFIVNLHKITTRKGNALGYQVSLSGCSVRVPVSRQNVPKFEQKLV